MKDLFVIIVVFILVFGGDCLAAKYYEKVENEIVDAVEDLSKSFDSDSQAERKSKVEKIKNLWEDKEGMLIMLQYHNSMNDIEDLIIECCVYYENEEETDFKASFEKLKRNIDDIKNRGRLSVNNVV